MYQALAIPAVVFGAFTEIGRSLELLQYLRRRQEDKAAFYCALQASIIAEMGNQVEAPSLHTSAATTVSVPAAHSRAASGSNSPTARPSQQSSDSCCSLAAWSPSIQVLAAKTPLPQSPSISQGSSGSPDLKIRNLPRATRASSVTAPSLNDLLEAERFVQFVLATTVTEQSTWHYDTRLALLKIPLRIFIWSCHSPSTLYARWNAVSAQRPFKFSVLIALLYSYPFYIWPPMFEKAILSPQYNYISPRALEAILDFHTAQLPEGKLFWSFVAQAVFLLGVVIGLILSPELAVRWNSIVGISSLGQVGQLIPAVLGVGGFCRVVWAWLSRGNLVVGEEDGVVREVRECAEVYERVKGPRLGISIPDYT